ncbi:MAG: hypothetical protein U1C97_02680 [Candidatus Gracilibacteria bacterium]|nr:hypothetical protein [Candidatus Gracilibacteria bacterium]
MNPKKSYSLTVLIFGLLTMGLFTLDLQSSDTSSSSPLNRTIKSWFTSQALSASLLKNTSLKEQQLISKGISKEFFSPYLNLPEKTSAEISQIGTSSILVSEVRTSNPTELVKYLTNQQSSLYRFNKINQETFYLNQIPAEKKTSNYLGIVINGILYGFQYQPLDHPKVLEIIDALQQTK